MGLLRIVSPRVSVKDEEVRRVLSNYPLFILMAESQDNTHTDYKISHGFRHQPSTAPATRAENTNLLAGVIFSGSEE